LTAPEVATGFANRALIFAAFDDGRLESGALNAARAPPARSSPEVAARAIVHFARDEAGGITSGVSAWRAEADSPTLVSQGAEFHAMVAEAVIWAERITCCTTAPRSERGTLPWWRELLARSSKCDAIFVRYGERAEGWLLHRLHSAGVLRLVDAAGPGVAHDLLMFTRADELRMLWTHVPPEQAVARAAFGAVLSFRGPARAELARACRAQAESWAELARIPTGREIDVLALDARRRRPRPPLDIPGSLRVVSEPTALAACVGRFGVASTQGRAGPGLDAACVRPFAGGYRLSSARDEARFVLTLYAGAYWAAGSALLLDDGAGRSLLVWPGDLLGPSRSRGALVWSEARLASFVLEDPARQLSQRVALVARSDAPLGPQLAAFADELARLSDVFGVEPPPALGHVLSDFATLSSPQQTLLVWKALIGAGAQSLDAAVTIAAETLRAQGYLRGPGLEPGGAVQRAIATLIENASAHGRNFDRPSPTELRAIQPDSSAYVLDDWLECVLLALPENTVVARRTALRLAFDWAREHWGLDSARLRRSDAVARALQSAVASALSRGLLIRVGAAGLSRLTTDSERPDVPPGALVANASEHRFVSGWVRALSRLEPLHQFLLSRRSGWYGPREGLASVAQRLGLALERAGQLEADAWRQVIVGSGWARALRARLERALGSARSVSVRELMLDDAWWLGLDRHLELCDAVLERLLDGTLHRVELEAPQREVFIARFSQAELDRTLGSLLDRAAGVEAPAGIDTYYRLADAACSELDAGLSEYLREALEARLELDPADATRVLGVASRKGVQREPSVNDPVDSRGPFARDVPGGHEAIASVLLDVTLALDMNLRPLDFDATMALAQTRVQQTWSPELVLRVIGGDPALFVSPEHVTSLRRWHADGRDPQGERPFPGVPAYSQARFEQLLEQEPLRLEVLGERLTRALGRLDRAGDTDDLQASSMARQLVDLCRRWLEQAATEPSDGQPSMQAAIQILLDAIATDEDDVDAPWLDRDELFEARAVLASVLCWLGLDWLEMPDLYAKRQ
jgi:hypothetical protein